MPQAKNGDKVRDIITGLEGIVTGTADYLTGCKQLLVNPQQVKDGETVPGSWLDIDRLHVLEPNAVRIAVTAPGPDREAPRK